MVVVFKPLAIVILFVVVVWWFFGRNLEIQQKNQLETSPVGEVLDILHKMQQKIDSLEEEIRELKEVSGERDVKLVQEMRKLLEEKEKKKPFWKSWFS